MFFYMDNFLFCVRLCSWFWFLSGHAMKNAAGALCSPIRTMRFGKHWTDSSLARSHGLPPMAYRRAEPMSDSLNATLWNPYYAIPSTETRDLLIDCLCFMIVTDCSGLLGERYLFYGLVMSCQCWGHCDEPSRSTLGSPWLCPAEF